jgi:TonB family protein
MNRLLGLMSDYVAHPRASIGLWLCAAVGAVALHAGGIAYAVSYAQSETSDEELGAPAIEIGLELASPKLEPTDLPPGPEAEASAASQAVMEQKAEAEKTDLPKDQPTETEDPDRVVSPDAQEKPKEDEPTKVTVQATQSSESVASEATAPPTIENAPEATKSVAPVQGTGKSAQRIRATWQKQLVAHIDRHKRYPSGSARRSVVITLQFTLDRVGHVLSVDVAKTSGDAAFDAAAVAMMRRSDPVPPPPPLVADEGLSFTMPIIFRAKS